MPVQFMNKTIWFVHVDVYTSLQLLEIVCWCRGFASGGWFDLPCSSLWLVLDLLHGLLLNRKQFFAWAVPGWGFWLCVLPVLSVLALWWLTKLPVDEWARVWLKKGYICLSLALSGRQQWWFHLVTPHSAGVLFSMHTCTVSCLCVCVPDALHLDVRGSARQSWTISSPFHYSSNLPSGNATWHNSCLALLCAGNQEYNQVKMKIIRFKHLMKLDL
jgi:hypothetical protein